MNEYLLFSKARLPNDRPWGVRWHHFVSAYKPTDRVISVAERVVAERKHWISLPEYEIAPDLLPAGCRTLDPSLNEVVNLYNFLKEFGDVSGHKIAIDITGFLNHYVLALLQALVLAKISRCDVLYSEPQRYIKEERTKFSDEVVLEVRQVPGYEGIHALDSSDDLLVLAVGYDHRTIAEVANDKEHSRKIQLFGFPSLRLDMFQQNLLQTARCAEAVGPDASHPRHFAYAPAYDPFVTASVVSETVSDHRLRHPRSNVYLSPLSTKPQTLGLGLYYLKECREGPTSIIYPYCQRYMWRTSEGLANVWRYHIELEDIETTALGGCQS